MFRKLILCLRLLITRPTKKLFRALGYDIVRLGQVPPPPLPPSPPEPTAGPLATNAVLRRIYWDGVVEDREGNVVADARMAAIKLEDGELLYNIVSSIRPERTLEVGLAYGGSTLFICEALRSNGTGYHTAMDPYQHSSYHDVGLLNVERAGFESMVTFYDEESCQVLPRLLAEGQHYGFMFIDGDHRFDGILIDFYYADKMLEPGGFLVLHDMDHASVQKAASFILRNRAYALVPPIHMKAPPFMRRFGEFLKNVVRTPLEPLLWPYYSIKAPHLCIVFQKTGDDHRFWTHYKSF